MNVLFITHCTPMDGGNHSLLQLMVELQREPYSIKPILLTPIEIKSSSSSILTEARKYGIKCVSSRFYPFKYSSRSPLNFVRYATNLFNVPAILNKLKGISIDLIHSNSSIFDIGAIIADKLKVPHIWHLREFGDLDFNLTPLIGVRQEKIIYRNASRFIAISESVRQRFLHCIDKNKIDVVYNGIPLKLISTQKRDNAKVNFCITGAVNMAKRQCDAVEAINILVNERRYTALHLTIIGEGSESSRLKKLVEHYNISPYVSFVGWVKHPEELYSGMDCGLMLSVNEAFGRVTIEYMRAGLLVIASDGGANKELIDDGVTGLLFNTGDVTQLADKMAFAIENSVLARKIASQGMDFSQNHFLSTDNTKTVFEIYLKYGTIDRQRNT